MDLYCTDAPCVGRNTTANPYLYAEEMTSVVRAAAVSGKPMFVYVGVLGVSSYIFTVFPIKCM